jgi:predicted NBD/HSP70 family sugar kinase
MVVRGGRQCECGHRGCLDTYCSEQGLVATWNERAPSRKPRDVAALAAAAFSGDPVARRVVRDGGRRLGRHIAALVNVMDPEIIVIGGEAVRFGELLFEPLRQEVAQCFGSPPGIAIDWENDGWPRGAAALAVQHFFDFEIKGGHSSGRTGQIPMSA